MERDTRLQRSGENNTAHHRIWSIPYLRGLVAGRRDSECWPNKRHALRPAKQVPSDISLNIMRSCIASRDHSTYRMSGLFIAGQSQIYFTSQL